MGRDEGGTPGGAAIPPGGRQGQQRTGGDGGQATEDRQVECGSVERTQIPQQGASVVECEIGKSRVVGGAVKEPGLRGCREESFKCAEGEMESETSGDTGRYTR